MGSARRSRPEVFDIVTHVLTRDPLLKGNWVELPSGLGLKATWNLLWTWSRPRIDYDHLLSWQRVNHYPRARNLTRKDCLARNVGRLRNLTKGTRFEGYFDVCPATFLLPQDYAKLVAAFRARAAVEARNLWIMKPTGSSRGRGISVVARLDDVTSAAARSSYPSGPRVSSERTPTPRKRAKAGVVLGLTPSRNVRVGSRGGAATRGISTSAAAAMARSDFVAGTPSPSSSRRTSTERRSCPLVLVLRRTSRGRRKQSNAARTSSDGARTVEIRSAPAGTCRVRYS